MEEAGGEDEHPAVVVQDRGGDGHATAGVRRGGGDEEEVNPQAVEGEVVEGGLGDANEGEECEGCEDSGEEGEGGVEDSEDEAVHGGREQRLPSGGVEDEVKAEAEL